MLEIAFLQTPDGRTPVEDYLDRLDSKQAAKVVWTLKAIQAAHPTPSNYLRKLAAADDIWEVRIIFAGKFFRLLGWMEGYAKLVLAHGFTKKTQKTPRHEIQLTETRKKSMKTKSTDDLDRYIQKRTAKDSEFAAAYESERAEWEIGKLLASVRESAGLTQEALAQKIGSTRSAICRYECHPSNLTLSTLEKMARATGRRLVIRFA